MVTIDKAKLVKDNEAELLQAESSVNKILPLAKKEAGGDAYYRLILTFYDKIALPCTTRVITFKDCRGPSTIDSPPKPTGEKIRHG